jgi:Zn-dependent protease with chaperone function
MISEGGNRLSNKIMLRQGAVSEPPATSGPGIFFDGATTARHDVTVELAPDVLRTKAADGRVLAEWPYDQLETLSSPDDVLRLGKFGNPVLARLEVHDPQLAAAIDELSLPVDRSGRSERRMRTKVIFWSLAATASLLLVAIVGLPLIATQLTPFIPYALERKLGVAIDRQARASLDTRHAGAAFECGNDGKEKPGRAAFDKLMGQMETAAALPIPLKAVVVRKPEANAFALPGGYIYVLEGLIDKAETPDELAGVIAHEIGHVAHRDGTRTVVQAAGLSVLFGMLLGDFVGGGAVVFAAKTLLQTSYTREVETAADGYGVTLMHTIGGDARALGAILSRIAGGTHPGPRILRDHPETRDRVAAIEAMAGPGPSKPLLATSEWAALKTICAGA